MRKRLKLLCCGGLLLASLLVFSAFSTLPAQAATIDHANLATSNIAAATASCPPTLSIGSTGKYVSDVQEILNFLGYIGADGRPLDIDGIFGPNTQYAVKHFQSLNNLSPDGIVGPKTWAKLGYC